jgi:hypothetical protein
MTQTANEANGTTWGDLSGGQRALHVLAPDAERALLALEVAAWSTPVVDLLSKAAAICSANLGLTSRIPADLPAHGRLSSSAEAVALEFAEQFNVDVASISDASRSRLVTELGSLAGPYVQGLYVVDFFPRTRAVLDALFGPSDPSDLPVLSPNGEDAEDLWDAAMHFLRVVALLDGLDPLTAELVRLRGASQHQCRLCKSVRNRSAIAAGGTDELFAAVDDPQSGALSASQRAAVNLAPAPSHH